jgi:hypothetical protein
MSRKRSAVKPSECENVSKKYSKKNARSSSRDFIRGVQSLHYTMVKRSMQGPYIGADNNFFLSYEYIKLIAQGLIFISLSALW